MCNIDTAKKVGEIGTMKFDNKYIYIYIYIYIAQISVNKSSITQYQISKKKLSWGGQM